MALGINDDFIGGDAISIVHGVRISYRKRMNRTIDEQPFLISTSEITSDKAKCFHCAFQLKLLGLQHTTEAISK